MTTFKLNFINSNNESVTETFDSDDLNFSLLNIGDIIQKTTGSMWRVAKKITQTLDDDNTNSHLIVSINYTLTPYIAV